MQPAGSSSCTICCTCEIDVQIDHRVPLVGRSQGTTVQFVGCRAGVFLSLKNYLDLPRFTET